MLHISCINFNEIASLSLPLMGKVDATEEQTDEVWTSVIFLIASFSNNTSEHLIHR